MQYDVSLVEEAKYEQAELAQLEKNAKATSTGNEYTRDVVNNTISSKPNSP